MPYCTQEELLKDALSEDELIQLTDDEGLGSVNADRVTQAITSADELIDGHLRGRYTLPLSPVPGLINKLALDLVVYYVHKRKLKLQMPESLGNSYKNCLKLLQGIQKGDVILGAGAVDTPAAGEGAYRANKTSTSRVFTDDVLDQM